MYRPFLADSVEAQCSQMLVRIARSLEMIAEFLMFSDVARSTPQDLRPAADLWHFLPLSWLAPVFLVYNYYHYYYLNQISIIV